MHKSFLKIAALLGAFSIAIGAFAAHALKSIISEEALAIFEVGVRYQFYHVFALLIIGVLYKDFPNKFLRWSGWFFIAGIILFSGSLYLLTAIHAAELPGFKWVGPITPLGGLCFISGWLFLFAGFVKQK